MIFDTRFTPPTAGDMEPYLGQSEAHGDYSRVYGSRVYDRDRSIARAMALPELLDYLDSKGIARVLLKPSGTHSVRELAHYRDSDGGDRVLLSTTAVPGTTRAEFEAQHQDAVADGTLRAVMVFPYRDLVAADDSAYHGIYEACDTWQIPVFIHASVHFRPAVPMEINHVRAIDVLAGRFPQLRIVAVHGGWPWTLEMMAIAWRHRHVFIDISGVRLKYMLRAGSGWEPLLNYGSGVLRDRVIWGSNWPQFDPSEGIDILESFPLSEGTRRHWLGDNAQRLFEK